MHLVRLTKENENMTEATVGAWLVGVGEHERFVPGVADDLHRRQREGQRKKYAAFTGPPSIESYGAIEGDQGKVGGDAAGNAR